MTGSSPDAAVAEVNTEVTTVDANATAEVSSASETTGKQPSLLDSVTEALKGAEKSPGSEERDPVDPAATQATGEKKPADATEADIGDITDAELKSYGPKTQKRIRQLLGQRDEARTETENFKVKAQNFDTMDQFARQNRMTPDDVSTSLQLGALIANGDPVKALQAINQIAERLNREAGNVLPPELQKRVELGYIAEEDARRLHQAELRETRTREMTQQERDEAAQERQRNEVRTIVDNAKSTGDVWEAARKASDPDWPLKQERFHELVELEVRRSGFPKTKQAVQQMLNDIAGKVDKETAKFAPKPQPVRHVTSNASPRATPEPTDIYEANRQALARM